MNNIIFISTLHNEIGKCNADELCRIIKGISPQVVFLEALDETYSKYEQYLFSSFRVWHKKLEIAALQKYSQTASFEYIPVLDNGLSNSFEEKYEMVCGNREWQRMADHFNSLAEVGGFKFLNSHESIILEEEMRKFESNLLNGLEVNKRATVSIDAYENSMLLNIYAYIKNSSFNSAVFMCGVAHRKSMIEKIRKFKAQEKVSLNWVLFEG